MRAHTLAVGVAGALALSACKHDAPAPDTPTPEAPAPLDVEPARAPLHAARQDATRAAAREGARAEVAGALEGALDEGRRWYEEVWSQWSEVERHNHRVLTGLFEDLEGPERRWRHVVVHHTASRYSTLEKVDRFHRRKFDDPDGIQYHFLIGNGVRMPEGQIAPGRWPLQKRAIHLFKPEGAPGAVAISLVGNFQEDELPEAQYQPLLELITRICRRHGIPPERVTTHRRVDGRLTACPGKHFPYERLIEDLRARLETGEPAQ